LAKEVATLRHVIQSAPHFETFEPFMSHLIAESGLNDASASKSLSLLLTGDEEGADVSCLYPYLKNYLQEVIK